MSKEKNKQKKPSTFGCVLRRMFIGSKDEPTTISDRYDSPSKQAVKRFFRKPLATAAVIILLSMFLFVFIGPLFSPIDLSYTEPMHTNVQPNLSMMKLPSSMKTNPVSIASRGTYTLGLDQNGNLHTWGCYNTFSKDPLKNVLNIPKEVQDADIRYIAAGNDHCVVIAADGTMYCWGEDDNGQFGKDGRMADLCKFLQPDELINGKVDVDNVQQLLCGNQMTALLMKDGTLHVWGNTNASCMNWDSVRKQIKKDELKPVKVAFTSIAIFVITEDGQLLMGNNKQYEFYKGQPVVELLANRKVVDIAATGNEVAILTADNQIYTLGAEGAEPNAEGEKVVSLSSGSRHFSLLTESGKVMAWGNGKLGQTEVPAKLQEAGAVDLVFSTGFQNYAFKDGKFVDSWGLKGYVFGTDDLGRDVFNRVMNGGKLTMPIGAVAVIVSTIIGVIIGCLSGYFGGAVDMLLMRVTEIFSAIPFLPFALVLSAVLQNSNLTEDTRIFIIMVILGLLSWTGLAKLVRGQVLAEREKEFVTAAKAMGVRERTIAFKHILPNIISVILVSVTLDFAGCMLTESSLSYLGFGVKLPRPTWGNMLDGCRNSLVIQNYWWRWVFPALFLSVAVICINIIGDTLRDVLDPKSEVEK